MYNNHKDRVYVNDVFLVLLTRSTWIKRVVVGDATDLVNQCPMCIRGCK